MLPPVFPPSLLLAKLVPVSVYSSAISHLPNSTFLPAFTPPLFPGTRIIVSWVGQPQHSPYPRIEQGRSGKGERGPSPERHLPLNVGAHVAAASSTIARLPGAVGACGCPWEPMLAQAAMSAHRCLCLPVHARVYVWATVATWAP